MARRRLPIGLQTFREVRGKNCYYVDKTDFVRRLLDEGKHYFLSRGLNASSQELVPGHAEGAVRGQRTVVRVLAGDPGRVELSRFVIPCCVGTSAAAATRGRTTCGSSWQRSWRPWRRRQGSPVAPTRLPLSRFRYLIRALQRQSGQPVAVLVDEYDKRILDQRWTCPEIARANRDLLRGLYVRPSISRWSPTSGSALSEGSLWQKPSGSAGFLCRKPPARDGQWAGRSVCRMLR